MQEQGSAGSVDPAVGSSVTTTESATSGSSSKDMVAFETHRRVLDERKKLEARANEAEAKLKAKEEAELIKNGEKDKLLEIRNQELAKVKGQLDSFNQRIEMAEKKSAVIDAIGSNIDPKWHRHIDISQVALDPNTGEVDALTVAKVAEAFKREFPEALRKSGQLPADAPQGVTNVSGKISRGDFKKLPLAEMRKWKMDQIID